jgi:creatinine amidohydrolase/Fe(II)-dependent formamide hydrolase-like protein
VKHLYVNTKDLRDRRIRLTPTRYFEDYTNTGAIGDPTTASKEFGAKIVDSVVERIVDALRWYKSEVMSSR